MISSCGSTQITQPFVLISCEQRILCATTVPVSPFISTTASKGMLAWYRRANRVDMAFLFRAGDDLATQQRGDLMRESGRDLESVSRSMTQNENGIDLSGLSPR
jgi:hypothetical protein